MENEYKLTKRYIAHFGAIFSHIALVALIVSFVSLFSSLFSLLFVLLWIMLWLCLLIMTFGGILYNEHFDLNNGIEKVTSLSSTLVEKVAPVSSIIALVFSLLALIFLLFDNKWSKGKAKKVMSIVTLSLSALAVAIIALIYFGGAK